MKGEISGITQIQMLARLLNNDIKYKNPLQSRKEAIFAEDFCKSIYYKQ